MKRRNFNQIIALGTLGLAYSSTNHKLLDKKNFSSSMVASQSN